MTDQLMAPVPAEPRSRRESWVDGYLPAPYAEPQPSASPMIDVQWLRGALYRQRWLLGATILLALIGGLIATLLATPIYEARASVRISPYGEMWIVQGQEATAPVRMNNELDPYLTTQPKIIESRKVAESVAERLNAAAQKTLLGADIDERRPAGRSDEEWANDKRRMTASVLMDNVDASVPRNELVVDIVFRSEDAALAAEVANAYADVYIQSDLQRAVEGNAYARQYLTEQIEEVRGKLDEVERAANDFARDAGIVTPATVGVDGETGMTITGANLSSINQTVAAARAKRIAAEQKWRTVVNLPAEQLPEVQSNAAIQALTAEKAKLSGVLTSLRERYNEEFPEIVDIKGQIALLDQQIASSAADIKAGIRNAYLIAQRQEQALEAELDKKTNDALSEQDRKVEYTNLERNAQSLRQQLSELLTRYNQISTASNIQSNALTLLDSAVVPRSPVSPSLTRNLMLALVLGIAIAGGLAVVREIFIDQFRRAEDVEDRLGLPVLGLTPNLKLDDIDHKDTNPFGSLVEAYASIRSTIDFTLPRDGAVLQFTSSQAAEGKSTTALILAELFARLGRRTLLIDCDLRKPSIINLLDVEQRAKGLAEVLLDEALVEEAIIEGVHENLHILSVAEIPSNPIELLSSPRFRDFIAEQRKHYSMILLDSPPVLGLADAPEIGKHVDATVFVIEANRTSFAQARTASERMKKVGANIVGAILTKYRPLEAGADYSYQYQYYQYGSDTK